MSRASLILLASMGVMACFVLDDPTAAVAAQTGPDAVAPCALEAFAPTAPTTAESIRALIANLPVTTRWADLPARTKGRLQQLAGERLAEFRRRWAADALARKQAILLECATPAMTSAIDDFYRKFFATIVPPTFSHKNVRNAAFGRLLVRSYLGTIAARRATLAYPDGKLPSRDWDGTSAFDSVRLPDERTHEDIRTYNAEIAADLRKIDDASLDDSEKPLKQRLLLEARANAAAALTACVMISRSYDVIAGYERAKTRPGMFASDDAVLREINALYLGGAPLAWLDAGTFASATGFCDFTDPDFIEDKVGDPATNVVAKGMVLLQRWWIERVAASADARRKCTVYSALDRARIWEAFSAEQLFDLDGASSMDAYRVRLRALQDERIAYYRKIARLALSQVFPDEAVLTAAQRRRVIAAIETETMFGQLPAKVAAALDAAQGTAGGAAATRWKRAITASVVRIGGNYRDHDPVRPADRAALEAMFEEVKAWLASRYRGYPIDIPSLLAKITFVVTTADYPGTAPPGRIEIGVGTAHSRMEYLGWIIHELRHAVYFAWLASADRSKAQEDEGLVLEGSGVAAEDLLLEPFITERSNDDAAHLLNVLDYGIRDARLIGTTDAVLQVYFRAGCAGANRADTIGFARTIGAQHGLIGAAADTVALRAHAGTQYLQYIAGGQHMRDAIADLQGQVDPSGRRRVDPFVLFACGLNTPRRDAAYVAALKACMKLGP